MTTLLRATEDIIRTRSYLIEDDDNSYGTSFAYIQYFDVNNTNTSSIILCNDNPDLNFIQDEELLMRFSDYIASIPPEDVNIEPTVIPQIDEFPEEPSLV